MILILIFAEVLGLYGLIVALILTQVPTIDCHSECYNPCCKGVCTSSDDKCVAIE